VSSSAPSGAAAIAAPPASDCVNRSIEVDWFEPNAIRQSLVVTTGDPPALGGNCSAVPLQPLDPIVVAAIAVDAGSTIMATSSAAMVSACRRPVPASIRGRRRGRDASAQLCVVGEGTLDHRPIEGGT
jgi:hypothetical protein